MVFKVNNVATLTLAYGSAHSCLSRIGFWIPRARHHPHTTFLLTLSWPLKFAILLIASAMSLSGLPSRFIENSKGLYCSALVLVLPLNVFARLAWAARLFLWAAAPVGGGFFPTCAYFARRAAYTYAAVWRPGRTECSFHLIPIGVVPT